jgi:fumarate hydratase subunit beta
MLTIKKGVYMDVKLKTPLSSEQIKKLKIGDVIHISGTVYTARDRAHQRILKEGSPFNLEGAVIFHAGPIIKIPNKGLNSVEDAEIVSIGPTTSTRMNPYEVEVIRMGTNAIIGKGGMDQETSDALVENKTVYLAAVGGCAALYVKSIIRLKNVYWIDLGIPEAVWEIEVQDFGPLIVAMDSHGGNLYEEVRKRISA